MIQGCQFSWFAPLAPLQNMFRALEHCALLLNSSSIVISVDLFRGTAPTDSVEALVVTLHHLRQLQSGSLVYEWSDLSSVGQVDDLRRNSDRSDVAGLLRIRWRFLAHNYATYCPFVCETTIWTTSDSTASDPVCLRSKALVLVGLFSKRNPRKFS